MGLGSVLGSVSVSVFFFPFRLIGIELKLIKM
jgi:hypothetical protein